MFSLMLQGKEYTNDAMLLQLGPASQFTFVYSKNPNPFTDLSIEERSELDASSPANIMSQDTALYTAAIAFAGISMHHPCDNQKTARHAPPFLVTLAERTAVAAWSLLKMLPTSHAVVHDISRVLTAEDHDAAVEEVNKMICRSEDASKGIATSLAPPSAQRNAQHDRVLKTAVLLYAIQTMCTLILPAKNPLHPKEDYENKEVTAVLLLSRLFPSGVFPLMLDALTAQPSPLESFSADATARAHREIKLHQAMLLLASAACTELRRHASSQHDPAAMPAGMAEQSSPGYPSVLNIQDGVAASALAKYAITAMCNVLGCGRGIERAADDAAKEEARLICPRALDVFDACIAVNPSIIEAFTPITKPVSDTASTPTDNGNPSALADHGNNDDGHEISPSFALARVILSLVNDANESVRLNAAEWLSRVYHQIPSIKQWVLQSIIHPLILADSLNDEQTKLCMSFLSTLDPMNDKDSATGLFQMLFGKITMAAEQGLALKSIAKMMIALIRQMDGIANGQVSLISVFI